MDIKQYETLIAARDEDLPSGYWAGAPAVAATTVDMVNNSGRLAFVFVTGTVTVIKTGGVTTGLTTSSSTAMVPVRNGEALNLTFGSAPTVHWLLV